MSFFSRFTRKSGKSLDKCIDAENDVGVHKFLSLVNSMPKTGSSKRFWGFVVVSVVI
jgi:hypothetical protein